MERTELLTTIRGLQNYLQNRVLDDYSKNCIDRALSDMKDDYNEMLLNDIYNVEDI